LVGRRSKVAAPKSIYGALFLAFVILSQAANAQEGPLTLRNRRTVEKSPSATVINDVTRFGSARFGATEAEVRRQFELGDCASGEQGDRVCSFRRFDLGNLNVRGNVTFYIEAMSDVVGIFSAEQFPAVQEIFRERYGQPDSAVDGQLEWQRKLLLVRVGVSSPPDRKNVIATVIDAHHIELMDAIRSVYRTSMAGAREIYALTGNKHEYEVSKDLAERRYGKDRAEAQAKYDGDLPAHFGYFSLSVNHYVAELLRRDIERRKTGASSLGKR
jgi:hypothetical protein